MIYTGNKTHNSRQNNSTLDECRVDQGKLKYESPLWLPYYMYIRANMLNAKHGFGTKQHDNGWTSELLRSPASSTRCFNIFDVIKNCSGMVKWCHQADK